MVLVRRSPEGEEVGAAAAVGAPLLRLGLLLAVAACCAATATAAATGAADTGGNGTTAVCDTVRCGMGRCNDHDMPWPLPYMCVCNPGWSQPKLAGLPVLIAPCFIPDCPFEASCFNLSLAPPKGLPITDPCVAINCGDGGDCHKKGQGLFDFSYSCDCHPGYVNFLNLTMLPCIKPCSFGSDCSKLGIGGPPPAPAPSTAAPPPGAVSSSRLVLLLAALAMVQVLYLRR